MAQVDKLTYFPIRARGEAIRMMYWISGTALNDERISFENWPTHKAKMPTGQIPVLDTKNGKLNQSNTIARYVAKKLGMFGNGIWEEALHDMVIENVLEVYNEEYMKIHRWMIFKSVPEPENTEQLKQEVKDKWIQCLNYIQSINEKQGKKFIVNNQIGAADIWLYATLEFSKPAVPGIMTLTPWTEEFTTKMEADDRMKTYLVMRPDSVAEV